MSRIGAIIIGFVLSLATDAAAQPAAEISFPLGEHYRIGKYVPVRVVAKTHQSVRVEAPGVVPVVVLPTAGSIDTVAPLLAVGTIRHDDWHLRPLADDERLVGTTISVDAALTASLFPSQRIVDIALTPSDPLPGAPLAWSALDAVFLDVPSAARVTEGQLATLLAAGTVVAVRTAERPAENFSWQRQGEWWVARSAFTAFPGVVQPDRYAALAQEHAGLPARDRHTLLLGLTAFSLAVLGISLWRSRHTWAAGVVISLASAGALWLTLSQGGNPIEYDSTHQRVPDGGDERTIRFHARTDGRVVCPVKGAAMWPILWSDAHPRELELGMGCDARGEPTVFQARLKRSQSLLFLSRSFEHSLTPTPPAATAPSARSR